MKKTNFFILLFVLFSRMGESKAELFHQIEEKELQALASNEQKSIKNRIIAALGCTLVATVFAARYYTYYSNKENNNTSRGNDTLHRNDTSRGNDANDSSDIENTSSMPGPDTHKQAAPVSISNGLTGVITPLKSSAGAHVVTPPVQSQDNDTHEKQEKVEQPSITSQQPYLGPEKPPLGGKQPSVIKFQGRNEETEAHSTLSVYTCQPPESNNVKFKNSSLEENAFFSVGVTSDQGARKEHEDADLIALKGGNAFFVVCDGHGGSECARNSVRELKDRIERDDLLSSKKSVQDLTTMVPTIVKEIDTAFCALLKVAQRRFKCFFELFSGYFECNSAVHRDWLVRPNTGTWSKVSKAELMEKMELRYPRAQYPDIISQAEKGSCKELQEWILKKAAEISSNYKNCESGNTFVGALVKKGDKEEDAPVLLFNLGDSRAVVYDKKGKVKQATKDHKPNDAQEKERIKKAGGSVFNGRINGDLAVARAMGDPNYKKMSMIEGGEEYEDDFVSSDVEVFSQQSDGAPLTLGYEDFMILACDGLWDVMTNEEAGQFVVDQLKTGKDLKSISSELVQKAFDLWSRDNVTAMVVTRKQLPHKEKK